MPTIPITKMQGAGNDFVVLDETTGPLGLSPAQLRWLAHRQFGVGADQILVVGLPPKGEAGFSDAEVDFSYRIFNADGGEVQHCGNGARCFVRYVRQKGLTNKRSIRVRTVNADLTLTEAEDGQVTVNMGPPRFAPSSLPFDAAGLVTRDVGKAVLYELPWEPGGFGPANAFSTPLQPSVLGSIASDATASIALPVAVASMGNPHAVVQVASINHPNILQTGLALREHPRFAQGVNAGFMQVLSPTRIKLRVVERGVGETLACGTGACAAVACGVQAGWLQAGQPVVVETRGGLLSIRWAGGAADAVLMTGPATTVFSTHIDVPDHPPDVFNTTL